MVRSQITPIALRAFSERRICDPRAISPAEVPTTSHIDAVATVRVQPRPGISHGGMPAVEITTTTRAIGEVMAPTTSSSDSARWARAALVRAPTHRSRSRSGMSSSQFSSRA